MKKWQYWSICFLTTMMMVFVIHKTAPGEQPKQLVRPPVIKSSRAMAGDRRLTAAERDLIERVVAAEARGEPEIGQRAVAQVIKDRVRIGTMGKTAAEVVLRPGQFAKPYRRWISPEVKEAVAAVFDRGERVTQETMIYFAAPARAEPRRLWWMRTYRKVATFGNQEFYSWEKQ